MSVHKTVVLDVVALTSELVSEENTPFLWGYLTGGAKIHAVEPTVPALTCTAQATYLTGKGPKHHGIPGNGWYDRAYSQVYNWHQSSGCVREKRLWHFLKKEHPQSTVFVNGLWHGMYDEDIDFFVNVRPQYLQDGGKVPDIYTKPSTLRKELQGALGTFPLHKFWGPGTGIAASKWIMDSTLKVDKAHNPTLTCVYLPHMDYSLQKYGPLDTKQVPQDLREIDALLRELVSYYEAQGARLILLSEYGISPVDRPVYLNRILRKAGFISTREECGGETLDCGACRAFALCDHQVAHVHLKHPSQKEMESVKAVLAAVPGVQHVFMPSELDAYYHSCGHPKALAHNAERAGDLVCISDNRSWFAYYYWLDDKMAPDFARCVAIHRKPGYDPAEMLWRFPQPFGFMWLLFKLLLVYLFRIRTTVDATPLDCASIRGSHGRVPEDQRYKPVLISKRPVLGGKKPIIAEGVYDVIWDHLVGG